MNARPRSPAPPRSTAALSLTGIYMVGLPALNNCGAASQIDQPSSRPSARAQRRGIEGASLVNRRRGEPDHRELSPASTRTGTGPTFSSSRKWSHPLGTSAFVDQNVTRADGRMPGEKHLLRRRENANASHAFRHAWEEGRKWSPKNSALSRSSASSPRPGPRHPETQRADSLPKDVVGEHIHDPITVYLA